MKNIENLSSPSQNFAGLTYPYTDFETAKVVILPVPYDSTTEWHSGTREGPYAIINASHYLELYDIESDREFYKVGIHTLPFIQPVLNSPWEMIQRVYQISADLLEQDKFVIMLGGEHSLTLGTVKALKDKYTDLCVLQLDAHADLRDEYSGTKYNHACTMRRLFEYCPITQIGIRSLSQEEHRFAEQNNLRLFYNSTQMSDNELLQQILNSLGTNVYITIDLDVFDPSIMSAVGTPEPGGMQWHEVLNILKIVAQNKNVVGFDLMELCPREGPDSCSFLAAKLAYKLIGYITT